jgi:hypothetical protein
MLATGALGLEKPELPAALPVLAVTANKVDGVLLLWQVSQLVV